jgi:hypothetical protein
MRLMVLYASIVRALRRHIGASGPTRGTYAARVPQGGHVGVPCLAKLKAAHAGGLPVQLEHYTGHAEGLPCCGLQARRPLAKLGHHARLCPKITMPEPPHLVSHAGLPGQSPSLQPFCKIGE